MYEAIDKDGNGVLSSDEFKDRCAARLRSCVGTSHRALTVGRSVSLHR